MTPKRMDPTKWKGRNTVEAPSIGLGRLACVCVRMLASNAGYQFWRDGCNHRRIITSLQDCNAIMISNTFLSTPAEHLCSSSSFEEREVKLAVAARWHGGHSTPAHTTRTTFTLPAQLTQAQSQRLPDRPLAAPNMPTSFICKRTKSTVHKSVRSLFTLFHRLVAAGRVHIDFHVHNHFEITISSSSL